MTARDLFRVCGKPYARGRYSLPEIPEEQVTWVGDVACHAPRRRASLRHDFAGREFLLPSGRRLEAIGYRVGAEDAVQAVRRAVLGIEPEWVECWQEDGILREGLRLAGYHHAGTIVRASSELRGLWCHPRWVATLPYRDPVDDRTLARLRLEPVDVAQLAHEAARADGWAQHYSSYNLRKSWTALALVGYDDDPTFIIKPTEMARQWQLEHRDRLAARPGRTRLADVCPVLMAAVDSFGCEVERARLMRVAAGGGLSRHADITNRDAGTKVGKVARLHLPLQTDPASVWFEAWDANGDAHTGHLELGAWYYLDQRKPHAVAATRSLLPRIHLVVDLVVSARLQCWIADAEDL